MLYTGPNQNVMIMDNLKEVEEKIDIIYFFFEELKHFICRYYLSRLSRLFQISISQPINIGSKWQLGLTFRQFLSLLDFFLLLLRFR